jgi:hypothetical protein
MLAAATEPLRYRRYSSGSPLSVYVAAAVEPESSAAHAVPAPASVTANVGSVKSDWENEFFAAVAFDSDGENEDGGAAVQPGRMDASPKLAMD